MPVLMYFTKKISSPLGYGLYKVWPVEFPVM